MNIAPQQMLSTTPSHLLIPFLSPPLRRPLKNHPKLNLSQLRFASKPVLFSTSPSIPSSFQSDGPNEFDVELRRMLALLPEEMRRRLDRHPNHRHLTEVVMDLGRKPLARFPSGDFVLSDDLITSEDLERASSLVGDFAVDNRAGISRTLHRISAIRNRKGLIIGLTCRVGRAVSGSANLLRDLVKDGSSLLLIGPPGVGKTTIIRDIARMLANDYKKRVMIVDTSNEIGGDGDIPHVGIGNARRMQVPHSDVQHKVMIEAVENHMPQVIVIDEIGTKLEAMAATTIAQRGIQLVATAHGITIKNLVKNPSLEMLVGGVQCVTLGDEEASRRGVQKTVLERKGPSTFHSGVEIVSKNELRVHRNLESTVDTVLSGRIPIFEVRKLNQGSRDEMTSKQPFVHYHSDEINGIVADGNSKVKAEGSSLDDVTSEVSMGGNLYEDETPFKLYIYGISETSAMQVITQLKMDGKIKIIGNISEADGLLALLSKLKKNSRIQTAAKSLDIPIYITKTTSLRQIMKGMRELIDDRSDGLGDCLEEGKINISEKMDALDVNAHSDGLGDCLAEGKINISEKMDALEEARIAIEQIVIPNGEPVELLPRPLNLLLLQKELIRKYHLQSRRVGVDPDIRLQILPFQTTRDKNGDSNSDEEEFDDVFTPDREKNGSAHIVNRLPLLPE